MLHRISLFLVVLFACTQLVAQPLSVTFQHLAVFPANVSNLSIVDGQLYAYSGGLHLCLPRISGAVTGVVGDTVWSNLDNRLDYVVRNPRTGNLFFTSASKKGSALYERIENEDKSPKISKVKMRDAQSLSVEHPVFSEDGSIMVFATSDLVGMGGKDLWYSEFDTINNIWGRPRNMGVRVNTAGDEGAPVLVDGFLLFASRNRQPDDSAWSLYATRFKSDVVFDDTARLNTIGLAPVQKLPSPINSSADDYELAADLENHALYLLSRRKGTDALYLCVDALRCALLHGHVATQYGKPLPHATVRWCDNNGNGMSTETDASGDYQLLLKAGRSYQIGFSAEACFDRQDVIPVHQSDRFFADVTHDVVLDDMPMEVAINYTDVFAASSADFTSKGFSEMGRLAEFLSMNPNVTISVSLSSAAFGDMLLDKMLSDSRIESLQEALNVPESRINCTNTTYSRSRQKDARESEVVVKLHNN